MTALVQDKKTEFKEGVELPFLVAALTKMFAGAFACVNAAGYMVPGADAAGLIFQGISRQNVDNSLGGNGDAIGLVHRRGVVKATLGHAITVANIGDNVFLVDDQTVDLIGNVTNGIFAGIIAGYIDATHAWIDIEPAIKQADVAAHIADGSGAHAASAISHADAGNYFPAAVDTVEKVLQHLAKGPRWITLHTFTGWTKDGAAHNIALPAIESPVPIRIKRAYANLGVASSAGHTLALTLNGTALLSIADAATKGEAEALDISIAADTDLIIAANETAGGLAENCMLTLLAYIDDGE